MLIKHITPVIIAKDAQSTIALCLNGLLCFEEVILYLNESSDETEKIAQTYKNVKIVQGRFDGFGSTKNRAITFSSKSWILSLDSDEVLSEDFTKYLSQVTLDDTCVYKLIRSNFYKENEIKYCWGKDNIVRLFHKEKTSFSNDKVHEYVIEDGFTMKVLDGVVQHYPYTCMSDFIVKLDRYSTLFAQDNVGNKKSSPLKAILNAHYSFFKTYILKRGFLDGYAGLVIAFSHMATNLYKYMKLYEMNKVLQK